MSESGIVIAHADIGGVESLFRSIILEKLGDEKDALKAFDITVYEPRDPGELRALKQFGKRLFLIQGALGLNDGGRGWKVFQTHIEEGLAEAQDREIAGKLAHQCVICVAKMRREAGLSVADIKQHSERLRKRNDA